jgi:hypothetical protein
MNRLFLVFILMLSTVLYAGKAQPYRSINNEYFKRGEKLTYKVAFHSLLTGNLTAGTATLEVTKENKQIGGRDTYHAVGYGKTTGLIEMFYKVEERFESYFDEKALIPWFFSRRTRENNYVKNENITFRHQERIAVSPVKVTTIPENVQDVISAFYYARCIDITGAKPGKEYPVPFMLDDSVYQSKIRFVGRETVKTRLGKINCLIIKPMVATGYVFEDPYPVTLWISDDGNRIPVLVESALSVGSVRIELTSYSGLTGPINFKHK